MDALFRALRTIACGLTMLVIVHIVISPARWPQSGTLPGYAATVAWLFVSQTVLVAVLAALVLSRRVAGSAGRRCARWERRSSSPSPPSWPWRSPPNWSTGSPTCSIGTGRRRTAWKPALPAVQVGDLRVFLSLVIALLVAGLVTRLTRRGRRRAARAIVAADFRTHRRARRVGCAGSNGRWPGPIHRATGAALRGVRRPGGARPVHQRARPAPAHAGRRGAALRRGAEGHGRLPDRVGQLRDRRGPARAGDRRHIRVPDGGVSPVRGVLWDLGTFWPRAAHLSPRPATPSGPYRSWRSGSPTSWTRGSQCCWPGTVTARCCSPRLCCNCRPGSPTGWPC
ncbi:hypothetical protein NKG94_11445 [Micromonospora sp. M12]